MQILDTLADFKQFLFSNFSSIGAISLIIAGCVVILSFAAREVFTWMTKTDLLRKEIRELRKELQMVHEDLKNVQSANNQKPKTEEPPIAFEAKKPTQKESAFPLNH